MTSQRASGFVLQSDPLVYVAALPGGWLLERTTPSWRIEDPQLGFQRVVRRDRAEQIAVNVLDQGRSFPNAVVLATDALEFDVARGRMELPSSSRFLVVDGQHRLWAQNFSEYDATYACVIHMGLTEVEMAKLFLEINDNQKRVPSSLRWDLVRLVRPEDDGEVMAAADLVYALATTDSSPLYQRVDLTGEQNEISLKQGSLAPGIQTLLKARGPIRDAPLEDVYDLLVQFLIALRDKEPDVWGTPQADFYKARVLRALLRLLSDIATSEERIDLTASDFEPYLDRISPSTVDTERIRALQGNAGMAAIYREIHTEVFGEQ